ncbi:unnamed protein product [Chrysoparadoxa australica]
MNGATIDSLAPVLRVALMQAERGSEMGSLGNCRVQYELMVVKLLLGDGGYEGDMNVLRALEAELDERNERLVKKLARVHDLQKKACAKVYLRRDEHLQLAKRIWLCLAEADETISNARAKVASPTREGKGMISHTATKMMPEGCEKENEAPCHHLHLVDEEEHPHIPGMPCRDQRDHGGAMDGFSLTSERWVTCGCSRDTNSVEAELRGAGSTLALECLAYMLATYPLAGLTLAAHAATDRANELFLLRRARFVCEIVIEVMQLGEVPVEGSRRGRGRGRTSESESSTLLSPTSLASKYPNQWCLLGNATAVEEMFVAGMLVLDMELKKKERAFPEILAHIQYLLQQAIQKSVSTRDQMWWALENVAGEDFFSLYLAQDQETPPPPASSSGAVQETREFVEHVHSDGKYTTALLDHSNLLKQSEVNALADHLPITMSCSDWLRLYSLAIDGASLGTLFAKCRDSDPTLVVIKSTAGAVFGGYASGGSWHDHGESYFGSGESFLFSFNHCQNSVHVYKWQKVWRATTNQLGLTN